MLIDDDLLLQYIHGFYGYGNYEGRYWLIGMEQGGGNSASAVAARLNTWRSRGKPELDGVLEFHRGMGLVGATGFEPATPCAQGQLGRAAEVLNSERFAALAIRCEKIWDQSSGEWAQLTAMPRDNRPAGGPPT